MTYAVHVVLVVVGSLLIGWGATDTQCWRVSEDVQFCSGTGTGLVAAVAGGVVVGASASAAALTFQRNRAAHRAHLARRAGGQT